MIALALIAEAAAAFAVNGVLLRSPGCSPTWLTISAVIAGFAPFYIGIDQLAAKATQGPLRPRWQYIVAAVLGVLAIALSQAPGWTLACPLPA